MHLIPWNKWPLQPLLSPAFTLLTTDRASNSKKTCCSSISLAKRAPFSTAMASVSKIEYSPGRGIQRAATVSPLLFLMIIPMLEGRPYFEIVPSTLTLYIPKGGGAPSFFQRRLLITKSIKSLLEVTREPSSKVPYLGGRGAAVFKSFLVSIIPDGPSS